jgi:predicted RNA-binding Zn-ribbon protein involved in translation (DUF1610 family)
MSEIERAIQEFEDNAYHTSMKPTISEASKAVALRILRAELSRQENAPLTCDGCKWHPIKYDFLNSMISRCQNCSRGTILVDRYESKEKIK